jgi:hypothetical protein
MTISRQQYHIKSNLKNKFWDELIAYFHFLQHAPQRKEQQFFVATGTCLPNYCLATVRGYTLSPFIRHGPACMENDASNSKFIVCARCHWNVCTEPLPSSDSRWYTYSTKTDREISEVCRWNGLRCHGIHTKFRTDWFMDSEVNKGRFTDSIEIT